MSSRAGKGRRLKVFGGWIIGRHGQVRAVVAVPSQKAAAEAFDVTIGHIRNYVSETGNAEDIEQAMTKPGTVFWRPMDQRTGGWKELVR